MKYLQTIMTSQWSLGVVGILALFSVKTIAEGNEAKDECEFTISNVRSKYLNVTECTFSPRVGQNPYVTCKTRLAVDPPMEETIPMDAESGEEQGSFAVLMDYTLEMELQVSENVSDEARGEKWGCLYAQTVTYDRVLRSDGHERTHVPLASRIFSVIANAEMISSAATLQQPYLIGAASVLSECLVGSISDTSSCLQSIKVNLVRRIGLPYHGHAGIVDFDITSYGYSRISGYRTDFSGEGDILQFRTYPDRTRRGKSLLYWLPGKHITSLRLPANRWSHINKTDFPDFPKLERLDFSRNNFEIFDSTLLNTTFLLKELNFSDSKLKKIPDFISKQENMRRINLGGNKFDYDPGNGSAALVPFIQNLKKLEMLNISGFTTKYFTNSTLPNLPNLGELDATRCEIIIMDGDSFVLQPGLVKIDLSHNDLNSLPPELFAKLKELKYLDLSFNKLTQGQGFIFPITQNWPTTGMQLLDMSENTLDSPANVISERSQVKHINLQRNVVRNLEGIRFKDVEFLDVSLNLIPALSYSAAYSLRHIRQINLTENQFNCDSCDLEDFKDWLNDNDTKKQLTASVDSLLCAAPPQARRNKIAVYQADYNEALCEGPNLRVLLGYTFTSIAIVAAVIGGVIYIYRFEVSYILHLIKVRKRAIKGEGKPHSECIYDAFVSYSGRDRAFVLRVLQPGLEECEEKYQLCLHDRNFALGGIITQNIVDSIEKSRKTILILSENFVDSQWCRWEMEMANHKLFNDSRDFLVLIELERLDRRNLPRHLRFLMDTRTYLEWPTETGIGTETKATSLGGLEAPKPNTSDQLLQSFWKRLHEALGDSLYKREQIALKEAEVVLHKSKQRDVDTSVLRYRSVHHAEEDKRFETKC